VVAVAVGVAGVVVAAVVAVVVAGAGSVQRWGSYTLNAFDPIA
jgi:hypothetical protein